MRFKTNADTIPLKTPHVTIFLSAFLLLAGCGPASKPQSFQATLPPTSANAAPLYTATPAATSAPVATATDQPTMTPSLTLNPTPVPPTSTPTQPPPVEVGAAPLSATAGWSCDDFPCEDDIDGFLKRIQVPTGFQVEHVGRFPGLPMQIAYGPDGRLYATLLENGTRNGAVYAMDNAGQTVRYSGDFVSPLGLAFEPRTGALYVSARVTLERGGRLWRVPPGGGAPEVVLTNLPCCFTLVENQPAGLAFGADGYLYMGIGSLTDHDEPPDPRYKQYADLVQNEASILRIQPQTGGFAVFASGVRSPNALAFAPDGTLYASDSGMLLGAGDRVLQIQQGGNYGWPYWRERGCEDCPPLHLGLSILPDFVTLPNATRPRGLAVYDGKQFPSNLVGNLFVALWNNAPGGQRVVRIDPHDTRLGSKDYTPEPFVTGLIRPTGVAVAPDGTLVVADYIYGHVWQVRYTG
jgi:glucose/arabinose dehydrogenase